jgi:hypothetical protein
MNGFPGFLFDKRMNPHYISMIGMTQSLSFVQEAVLASEPIGIGFADNLPHYFYGDLAMNRIVPEEDLTEMSFADLRA